MTRRGLNPPTRESVLRQADRICHYCGGEATTVDHVVPRSQGAGGYRANLVAACETCNRNKADGTYQDFVEGLCLPLPPTQDPAWDREAAAKERQRERERERREALHLPPRPGPRHVWDHSRREWVLF
jgi:5-methylcytosine-specific restriction endonuclease McrA